MIRHTILFNKDNKPPEPAPAQAKPTEKSAPAMVSDKITLSDGATIDNTPESLRQYNEMRKAAFEKTRQQAAQQQSLNTGKRCPLQFDPNTGSAKECRKDCVFYLDNSCALTVYAGAAERDTNGAPCPFVKRCSPACALFNGGCSFLNLMGAKPGKDE